MGRLPGRFHLWSARMNSVAFRFANPLLQPLMEPAVCRVCDHHRRRRNGGRISWGYYDHAGALRDMVQNHLMQLLCLVAMEPMVSFNADEIRNKKVDVLHAVRPIHRDAVHQCVVRGQYGQGWIGGKKVPGYREKDGVLPDYQTETFVALRLFLDNWRWQGCPLPPHREAVCPSGLGDYDPVSQRAASIVSR